MSILYTDLADAHAVYTFFGTARVDDKELAEQVWTAMPDRETAVDVPFLPGTAGKVVSSYEFA